MTTIHKALEQALGALEDLRSLIDQRNRGKISDGTLAAWVDLHFYEKGEQPRKGSAKAALTEGRKALEERAPSTAGERAEVIAELRRGVQPQHTTMSRFMYAATLAADMLEQDAALLQSPALPGAQSNLCVNCYADGKCMKRQALCHANGTALPVGELTDEQRKAAAICLSANKVSVSMVQRTMNIGYNAAQELCQSIIDAGLVPGLTISPSLTSARSQPASEQAAVSGWKLVPVEPTKEMNAAGYMKNLELGGGKRSPHETYKAMLAAAPEVKP